MSFELAWTNEARTALLALERDLGDDVRAKIRQLAMNEDILGREGRLGRFYSFGLQHGREEWRLLVRYWVEPARGVLTVSSIGCARTD